MFPRLFTIGGFTLHTYGALVATGVAVGVWLSQRLGRKRGLDPGTIIDLGIWMCVAGVLGSKLLLFLEDPHDFFSMATLRAAGVFYGGFLAALGTFLWFVHRRHLPLLGTADCYVPGLALGHAIGRLGCFAAGCCWGGVCPYPWAVTFTDPYAHDIVGVPLNVPLHPSQLYECAALLVICGILLAVFRRSRFAGQTFASYLMLYGGARFLLEYTRDLSDDPVFFHLLSLSQIVALCLIPAGAAIWILNRNRRPDADPDAKQRSTAHA
jgi:phosphatidylglycerol:prolipoprotein diacylglycerol transferase